jgi:ATP synthase protein I
LNLRSADREARVLNTLAAGRHLAARLLAAQLGVALVAGALFLLKGRHAAMAAAAGAVLVALGTALMASRALTRGRPDVVLMRVLTGMLLKWFVVLGGLYVVLVIWHLPPLPTIVGLVAALAVNLMALKFKEQ